MKDLTEKMKLTFQQNSRIKSQNSKLCTLKNKFYQMRIIIFAHFQILK